MAQLAGMELGKILEALRAVRDPDVNAQGAICGLHNLGSARLLNVYTCCLMTGPPSMQDCRHYGGACRALPPHQCSQTSLPKVPTLTSCGLCGTRS